MMASETAGRQPPAAAAAIRGEIVTAARDTALACLFRLGIESGVAAEIGAVERRHLLEGVDRLPLPRLAALAPSFGFAAEHRRLDWAALLAGGFGHPVLLVLRNANVVILRGFRRSGTPEAVVSDPLHRDGEVFFLSRERLERA